MKAPTVQLLISAYGFVDLSFFYDPGRSVLRWHHTAYTMYAEQRLVIQWN
jgi:hypothetical protein